MAGQATAIGISAGGVSARQLDSLKTRLENTKTQLQANHLQNLTGEQISGDLLTAVIWGWFAAAESHNRLSQNQAQMIENPGLSYGLFHAVAQPTYSWGVVRQVTFPGVNIDIGHIRNLSWAKDNDDKKWVSYNRLRGQYMSALEHAVPERFFSDPAKCNLAGSSSPVTGLPDCPQGISAVKALGIAAAQGQKIYTITRKVYNDNPGIVNTALSAHSHDTQSRVQRSLDVGYEVTIHESPITASEWTGAGFIAIDPSTGPSTGAGAYTIEGGSNGGILLALAYIFAVIVNVLIILPAIAYAFLILGVLMTPFIAAAILLLASAVALWVGAEINLSDDPCAQSIFQTLATGMIGALVGLGGGSTIANFLSAFLIGGVGVGATGVVKTCLQSP